MAVQICMRNAFSLVPMNVFTLAYFLYENAEAVSRSILRTDPRSCVHLHMQALIVWDLFLFQDALPCRCRIRARLLFP